LGLLLSLADGIKSAVVLYQLRFQQKNKYRLFVVIFGFGFAVGRDVRAKGTLNASAAASPVRCL
jgi:hypothetical protein